MVSLSSFTFICAYDALWCEVSAHWYRKEEKRLRSNNDWWLSKQYLTVFNWVWHFLLGLVTRSKTSCKILEIFFVQKSKTVFSYWHDGSRKRRIPFAIVYYTLGQIFHGWIFSAKRERSNQDRYYWP